MFGIIIISLFVLLVQTNANQFTNPLAPHTPDPWLEQYKGYYYLLASTFSNTVNIRKSKTLDGLHSAPNTVVYTINGHTLWAPELHQVNNHWYLYYTSCAPGTNGSCHRNRVAESAGDDPMGPYHFKADLIDHAHEGMEIDPSLLRVNGSLYLMGSYFPNSQNIYIQALTNPYTVNGPKHSLSVPTLAWEKSGWTINEAPEPLYHNGRTFVVYSASYCNTPDYKLGLLELVGKDPLNAASWHKHPTPVFQREDKNHVYGPGHNGFFKSPDGKEDWIVYHANDNANGHCDMNRSARAKKFTFGADGLPNFGIPDAPGVRLQSPSGE